MFFVVFTTMENEQFNKLATKAKDVLHLTEALYVAIRRDSMTAAEKYLQRAKDLGILKEVRLNLVGSLCSK